jgi:hypothetical protein
MAVSQYPETHAVDAEYAAAREAFLLAEAALKDVAKRREVAHLDAEYTRSREGQKFANMTDDEWEAMKQRVEAARGPKAEPVVNTPSAT